MHITVVCPGCQTPWRLEGAMIGKRIHCPNKDCRQIFLVDGQSPPPQQGQTSGSVGQMVPMLPAEPTAPAEPPLSPWHQNPVGWKPPHPSARIVLEPPPEDTSANGPNAPGTTESDWRSAPPRGRDREPAAPSQPPTPPPAPDWRSTPPQRAAEPPPRKSERRPPPPRPAPPPIVAQVVEDAAPAPPVELPPGSWIAPPIRNSAAVPIPAVHEPVQERTAARKRLSIGIMAGIGGFVIVAIAAGGLLVWQHHVKSEKFRAAEAQKAYEEGLFGKALEEFSGLQKDFPNSESASDYEFMSEASKVRKGPTNLAVKPKEELESMAAFLLRYGKHSLMPEHLRGIGETFVKLVEDHIIAKPPDHSVDELIFAAQVALGEMQGDLAPAVTPPERARFATEFARIRALAAKEEQRRADIARLQQLKPTIDGIRDAERLIRESGLQNDNEAKTILEDLYRKHLPSVVYTKEAAPKAQGGRAADTDRRLLVDARLPRGEASGFALEEGVVLALVRGVLYALRQADGAVQWAVHVGIDTTTLPVRVPPTPSSPELILVLSADTYTLTALETSGREKWKYRLSAPSLGRPVIIKDRAFLSTFDGQIHEIELASGSLLGRFTLGEGVKLSVGGVHQTGTNLVYFPADEFCIFVIDVEKHSCETILYSKHRSGALRGEPIIAGWTEKVEGQPVPQGYLFLAVAEDLDSVRLKAYPLPIENPRGEPLPMNPEPRARGWPWFPGHQDAEKLVQVTDAGMLALLGVKQKRNEDNPLFPLVPPNPQQKGLGGLDLNPLLKPKSKETLGRSLIAYAAEPDLFWVLARGQLQKLRLLLSSKKGPTVRADWPEAIDLGSPLHAGQVFDYPFEQGALKSPTLMLVTEPLTRETCLATAIDANDGTIRWQRQLGLVSRGEPLVLGTNVLALDQGGGLFTFDVMKFIGVKDEKLVGGRSLADSLDDGDMPPILLPGPDGKTAYEFAIPKKADGTNPDLIVRRYADQGGPVPVVQATSVPLRAPHLTFGGRPAISSAGILVPLSDGVIKRFDLTGKFVADGPNWRAGREEPDLRTHVVWLNEEEFLTTDGGRNINRWQWKLGANRIFTVPRQQEENEPTRRMPANIATAPLALAPAAEGDGVRALIACDDKTIYLLEGRDADAVKTPEDGLRIVKGKQWNPKGKITAGPFLLGNNMAVIVDRNRLMRFTADNTDPKEYKSKGEAIVGIPQMVEDMLIVADQSGRFVGLDPKTFTPRDKSGEGYKLRANVGPAASPVPFGPGQAFAPLTDGTILLLDLKHLRDK